MKKILAGLALCLSLSCVGQTPDIRAGRIRSASQLPVSSINRIFQDHEGYMWYGTVDGLCRDDGYSINVFRSDFHTPGLMDINSVLSMAEDHQGRIWFGTQKGVYILDKSDYGIKPLGLKELEIPVALMLGTRDGRMWVYGRQRLYCFDSRGKLLQAFPLYSYLNFLFEDHQGQLFYGEANGGLYMKKKETMTFARIDGIENPTAMAEDSVANCYWIGEYGGQLSRYTLKTTQGNQHLTHLPYRFRNEMGSSIWIQSIIYDITSHLLWIQTSGGLEAAYVDGDGGLHPYNTSGIVPEGRMILSGLYSSRDGHIYVSGFDTESFFITAAARDFRQYSITPLVAKTHYQPAIVTLCRDDDGIFWYYQEANGLFLYDAKNGVVVSYRDCPAVSSLPLGVIPYLVRSHDTNSVWVSTAGTHIMKLCRKGMQMSLVKYIDLKDVSRTSGNLEVIFEDTDGNLWIGTMNGVFVFRANDGQVHKISEAIGDVSDFTQTQDGRIWCTVRNRGLCCINKSGSYQLYPYKMDFLTLDATSDGTLWVSTGEGRVITFSSDHPSVIAHDYTEAAGLYGDMVDHIKIDRYNHVWIVTPQSVREFNPRNSALRVYSTQDADVPLRRFLPRAVWRDPAGEEMYFGGIPGLISMPASQRLESIPRNTEVKITDVKVAGKTIWLNGRRQKAAGGIEIRPGEDHLSLEFSSLDFLHLSRIRYAYRLQGVDRDWVYLPVGENRAVYNTLACGNYIFEVKSTDENGLWSTTVTRFTIHRLPAWYETWWAYLLYVLAGCLFAGALLRAYQQRLKSKNEQRLLEEVTQTKLRYFTNISHELLTPLTIISVIADRLRQQPVAETVKIDMIQGNVARLKQLLQQVLDFRKVESGKMRLYVAQGNIMDFVGNICRMSFEPLASSRDISLQISLAEKYADDDWFDHDKMDKVLFNLLSNALKYSENGQQVSVKVVTEDASDGHRFAVITIADHGRGIAPDQLGSIFNRFYSSARNDAGSSNGIGLSLTKDFVELHHGTISVSSVLGKGTVFTVRIPVDRESFSVEELKEQRQEEQQQLFAKHVSQPSQGVLQHSSSNGDGAPMILLAEDNRELLQLMQELLHERYRVLTASDGLEALAIIEQHREEIDIVVSDIRMPRMDGLELCRCIKADISTSHYIVVLLTAKVSTDIQTESYQAGADGYLSKPFEASLLDSLLSNLLNSRRHRQEAYVQATSEVQVSALGAGKLDETFISQAVTIVEEHLSDECLDVNFLAAELAMSRSTFARKVKAVTGQTPLDFIKTIKLKHAYQLLQNKTATVQDVMAAVGYNDHKNFTQSFREVFGILPSELIRQQRQNAGES